MLSEILRCRSFCFERQAQITFLNFVGMNCEQPRNFGTHQFLRKLKLQQTQDDLRRWFLFTPKSFFKLFSRNASRATLRLRTSLKYFLFLTAKNLSSTSIFLWEFSLNYFLNSVLFDVDSDVFNLSHCHCDRTI